MSWMFGLCSNDRRLDASSATIGTENAISDFNSVASAFRPVSGLPLAGASSWPPGVTQLHAGGLLGRPLQQLRQFGDVRGDAAGAHLA